MIVISLLVILDNSKNTYNDNNNSNNTIDNKKYNNKELIPKGKSVTTA